MDATLGTMTCAAGLQLEVVCGGRFVLPIL